MAEEYTETLLNVIMDEIDDIILIHDCEHRIVWMNRSGLKIFKVKLEDVMGNSCYTLFGRNTCCEDCTATMMQGRAGGKMVKTIPGTDERFLCKSVPLVREGEVKLVVQHLTRTDEK